MPGNRLSYRPQALCTDPFCPHGNVNFPQQPHQVTLSPFGPSLTKAGNGMLSLEPEVPARPFRGCVILGKSFNLTEPQFPYIKIGFIISVFSLS